MQYTGAEVGTSNQETANPTLHDTSLDDNASKLTSTRRCKYYIG